MDNEELCSHFPAKQFVCLANKLLTQSTYSKTDHVYDLALKTVMNMA